MWFSHTYIGYKWWASPHSCWILEVERSTTITTAMEAPAAAVRVLCSVLNWLWGNFFCCGDKWFPSLVPAKLLTVSTWWHLGYKQSSDLFTKILVLSCLFAVQLEIRRIPRSWLSFLILLSTCRENKPSAKVRAYLPASLVPPYSCLILPFIRTSDSTPPQDA